MLGRRKSRLDDTFRFKELAALERRLKSQSTLEAVDFQRFVDGRIAGLAQRLALDLDEPSWGLGKPRTSALTSPAVSFLPAVTWRAINVNAERSQRFWRFRGLYLLATLIGLAIAAGALYFDYGIMTEFWTRVFANEFMEVPESLAASVVSKSAQVVFATVAFHFMISSLSEFGRRLFIWLFFILTFGMIAGFGLLNANLMTPLSARDPGASNAPTTLSDALRSLGLGGADDVDVSDAPAEARTRSEIEDWMTAAGPTLWLVVPGIAFLAVTGIGALCVHLAETNVQNFVRAGDYRSRRKHLEEFETLQLYKTLIDRLVGAPAAYAADDEGDGGNVVRLPVAAGS